MGTIVLIAVMAMNITSIDFIDHSGITRLHWNLRKINIFFKVLRFVATSIQSVKFVLYFKIMDSNSWARPRALGITLTVIVTG